MQVKCIHDNNKSEFQSTHFRRIHLRLLYLIIVLSKDNACTKRLDRILISIRSTNYFRENPYRLDQFEWMRISSTLNFWKSQMQNPIRIQKHEITILCNFGNDTRFSRGLSGLFLLNPENWKRNYLSEILTKNTWFRWSFLRSWGPFFVLYFHPIIFWIILLNCMERYISILYAHRLQRALLFMNMNAADDVINNIWNTMRFN